MRHDIKRFFKNFTHFPHVTIRLRLYYYSAQASIQSQQKRNGNASTNQKRAS